MSDVRDGCAGVSPLRGRLEPWQAELAAEPDRLAELIAVHGSPVNLIDPRPMGRNIDALRAVAEKRGLELGLYFARKANKCLSLVDEAVRQGAGVDVASEHELSQVLARGVDPGRVILTAAVKPRRLIERAVAAGVTVSVDNEDELRLLESTTSEARPTIAMRLAPQGSSTRFGLDAARIRELALQGAIEKGKLRGIHFHLEGYRAGDRVAALEEAIWLADEFATAGRPLGFVDVGGGIPISYLESAAEWDSFWHRHREGLLGPGEPLTFGGHGLGLVAAGDRVIGAPAVYPFHQRPVGGEWLASVLDATVPGRSATVASAISARGLELRCEPGRALLDGCGLTAARVEFRKRFDERTWLIGLAMNRTQCRSTSEDFMVDPLLVRASGAAAPTEPIEGYLVGAYCIERELLTWRRLRFRHGVAVGDIVVFVNTAGYLMHILESASHQIPLARNLIVTEDCALDPIDEPVSAGAAR